MTLFKYLQDIYSLDTLDTRFTISATTPPKDALSTLAPTPAPTSKAGSQASPSDGAPAAGSAQKPRSQASPSKWNTLEFYFYLLVIFVAVPCMFLTVYHQSKESSPNYDRFKHLLSDGWIPGRKVDNSDAQYASFRNNIPYLCLLVVLHPLVRRAYDYVCRADTYTQVRPPRDGSSNQLTQGLSYSAAADARLEQRFSFDVGFALIFIVALHGISVFKILLILYANYKLATALPRAYVPVATWVFNIGILFANELAGGYPLAGVGDWMMPSAPDAPDSKEVPVNWGAWLDGWGGLMPRWEVSFNITVLRLISFNMDYYWSLNLRGASPIELDPSNLSERDRVSIPAKPADFSFRNYLAYVLYSPLYLAGPIVTFNDFIAQGRYRAPTIATRRTILYGVRFLLTLLAMEVMIHVSYAVAISKAQPDWSLYSPGALSMLGFFNLHHIWLKLLLPWRFFRLWGLVDGVDSPENMTRCMSNNYSALAFWRGWHRSYNRWIVRYIYIPLGGSGGARGAVNNSWATQVRAVLNYLAVFTFVALWHDIQLRLLMWGWLITLFVLPEVIAKMAFPPRKWAAKPTQYRMLSGIGAVGNILMMMIANLVGFAVGLDGLEGLMNGIVGSAGGIVYLLCACGALFVGAQVMFEIRQAEARKGISLKC